MDGPAEDSNDSCSFVSYLILPGVLICQNGKKSCHNDRNKRHSIL